MNGIIYKAENLITGKVYIGQTVFKLKTRIKNHYKTAKRQDYKFSRALRKYKKEDWKWEILEEVPNDVLNELEIKYIAQFNSFKYGYNSTLGGEGNFGNYRDKTIFELYKPETGILILTKKELYELDRNLAVRIRDLTTKRKSSINGYVLASNKDKYNEIMHICSLYHPNHGIITTTFIDFYNNYFNKLDGFKGVLYRKNISYKGWVLPENKDKYNDIFNILTLEHHEFGTYTLPGKEFTKQFNLKAHQLYKLKHNLSPKINGWKLVTAT